VKPHTSLHQSPGVGRDGLILVLDDGMRAVSAAGGFRVPLALVILVFDGFRVARDFLLLGGRLRGCERIGYLVGFETSIFAWALAIWLIITTALGYPYWLLEGAARDTAQFHFYENLGIIAAYLMLAVTGPGRYSIDGLRVL
jgi:uncharacterized membrane protein YphA (DoxX/SURF4 family)